jgi:hypothetical protein
VNTELINIRIAMVIYGKIKFFHCFSTQLKFIPHKINPNNPANGHSGINKSSRSALIIGASVGYYVNIHGHSIGVNILWPWCIGFWRCPLI